MLWVAESAILTLIIIITIIVIIIVVVFKKKKEKKSGICVPKEQRYNRGKKTQIYIKTLHRLSSNYSNPRRPTHPSSGEKMIKLGMDAYLSPHTTSCAGIACWWERQTRDWSREFESWQQRRENFLLQSSLCVLTLIRCLLHPRVTAVARKRPRSFYQKCRWQVAPKHAYTFDPTKSKWADYAAVQA